MEYEACKSCKSKKRSEENKECSKCSSEEGFFESFNFNVIVESDEEFYSFFGFRSDLNDFNFDSKTGNVEQALSIYDGKKVTIDYISKENNFKILRFRPD